MLVLTYGRKAMIPSTMIFATKKMRRKFFFFLCLIVSKLILLKLIFKDIYN